MNENNKLSMWYSWPVIIIVFCIFWPVAIYLIIKRVSVDRKTAMGSGKTLRGISIVSYFIAACGVFVCITEGFNSEDIVMIIFFGIAGVVLQNISRKTREEAEDTRKYLSIIVNGNIRQLDAIASSIGKPYDEVKRDVQSLIEKGYLRNAYINEGTREVVLPSPKQNNFVPNTNQMNAASVTSQVITCKCCGANNTIVGQMGECEYCGAALSKN